MTRNSNVRIIGDMEFFIDSLLAHTEEENCTHSVNDFLQEYFDKKNGRDQLLPNGISKHECSTNDSNPQPTDEEGKEVNRYC